MLPAIPYRSLPMDDTPHRPPLCVTEAQTGLHLLDISTVRAQIPSARELLPARRLRRASAKHNWLS
jgi:hypothetical protein